MYVILSCQSVLLLVHSESLTNKLPVFTLARILPSQKQHCKTCNYANLATVLAKRFRFFKSVGSVAAQAQHGFTITNQLCCHCDLGYFDKEAECQRKTLQ